MLLSAKKIMLKMFIWASVFANASFVYAAHSTPKIVIYPGSYVFEASYKLHMPSETSDLIVQIQAGSPFQQVAAMVGGPIFAGPFYIELQFAVNNLKSSTQVWPLDNGKHKILKLDRSSTATWYPSLNWLAKKLNSEYYTFNRYKKTNHPHRYKKVAPASLSVEPLPGSKLHISYMLQNRMHLPSNSQISRGVLVSVLTKIEQDAQGKEILTSTARFRTQRMPSIDDPPSIIKFVHTKNTLKEVSRTLIKRSSMWYPWVKKVVRQNGKQYLRFQKTHKKIVVTTPMSGKGNTE